MYGKKLGQIIVFRYLGSVIQEDGGCEKDCQEKSQKQNMVLLKLNQRFRGRFVSFIYILNKDGYGLTVTEIKDFMFSLAENYDIEL